MHDCQAELVFVIAASQGSQIIEVGFCNISCSGCVGAQIQCVILIPGLGITGNSSDTKHCICNADQTFLAFLLPVFCDSGNDMPHRVSAGKLRGKVTCKEAFRSAVYDTALRAAADLRYGDIGPTIIVLIVTVQGVIEGDCVEIAIMGNSSGDHRIFYYCTGFNHSGQIRIRCFVPHLHKKFIIERDSKNCSCHFMSLLFLLFQSGKLSVQFRMLGFQFQTIHISHFVVFLPGDFILRCFLRGLSAFQTLIYSRFYSLLKHFFYSCNGFIARVSICIIQHLSQSNRQFLFCQGVFCFSHQFFTGNCCLTVSQFLFFFLLEILSLFLFRHLCQFLSLREIFICQSLPFLLCFRDGRIDCLLYTAVKLCLVSVTFQEVIKRYRLGICSSRIVCSICKNLEFHWDHKFLFHVTCPFCPAYTHLRPGHSV
nr:MAG TPA: hypothetical protein [Caudoviricetes sp.]